MELVSLAITPVQTPLFKTGENLTEFVIAHTPRKLIGERMVLAVTSKIVSLAESRILDKREAPDKTKVVRAEADHFLGEIGHGVSLTIAKGLFIPSAGIDESNTEGDFYILYPTNPFESARKLWTELRKAWGLKELGVILTDSHTTPLRRGVTGIGLSFWGFEPTQKLVGTLDLYGRPFKMTYVNRVDGLSAATVLAMGEGTVPTPIAVVHGAEIVFSEGDHRTELMMPVEDDLYRPVYEHLLPEGDQV